MWCVKRVRDLARVGSTCVCLCTLFQWCHSIVLSERSGVLGHVNSRRPVDIMTCFPKRGERRARPTSSWIISH